MRYTALNCSILIQTRPDPKWSKWPSSVHKWSIGSPNGPVWYLNNNITNQEEKPKTRCATIDAIASCEPLWKCWHVWQSRISNHGSHNDLTKSSCDIYILERSKLSLAADIELHGWRVRRGTSACENQSECALIPNGRGRKIRQIIFWPWHWMAEQWSMIW